MKSSDGRIPRNYTVLYGVRYYKTFEGAKAAAVTWVQKSDPMGYERSEPGANPQVVPDGMTCGSLPRTRTLYYGIAIHFVVPL